MGTSRGKNVCNVTLSRIRLLRSTTINAFFLMVTSIWLAQGVYDNWKLAAFLGILFVVIAVASDGAHRNLLDNYYRKTAYVEKSYWKQKSQR